MLLSTLIDDVILKTYNGKPSDDSELPRSQVMHWLVIVRDVLVQQYLDLRIKAGVPVDTIYQTRETGLSPATEDLPDTEEEDERNYITLSYQPMSLYNDVGVQRVITEDGVMLNKSRSENIDWIKDLRYGKPTSKNPLWYRDNRKIILEGLSAKNLTNRFTVYYVPTATSQSLTEASTLVIGDELLDPLLTQVTKMAKEEIYNSTADVENDGQEVKGE